MKALLGLTAALAAVLVGLGVLAVLLGASRAGGACSDGLAETEAPTTGSWLSTAYGPPWGGIDGNGMTATGMDLRAGPPVLEVAADARLIPLGSYVHVWPNPFGTHDTFYVGDTGGAIVGRHIDFYDWRGRASQQAWGTRRVTVTPAPRPGGTAPLGGVATTAEASAEGGRCAAAEGSTGETARILPDGRALAPSDAPAAVKLAIAAGNLIHTHPYPEPDVHYGTLARLWPAYDCSGAVSFVLYGAGLLGPSALDSTGLESYGAPGPGRWITVYANSAHTWIVVAGIALDTANYGGSAIPAGSGPRWRSEPLANLRDGLSYVTRHPPGL